METEEKNNQENYIEYVQKGLNTMMYDMKLPTKTTGC